MLPLQGVQVRSLVGELRHDMQGGQKIKTHSLFELLRKGLIKAGVSLLIQDVHFME